MKASTENDNNFGHEKTTILVDNTPLRIDLKTKINFVHQILLYNHIKL